MSMYMTGFHFSLWETDSPCLNFLWPSFTLESRGKFYMAMIFTVALGILVEVFPLWRMKLLRRMERFVAPEQYQHQPRKEQLQTLLLSIFHAMQALLGYILMLIAMTYSVELILSILTGVSLGFYMSFKMKKGLGSSSSSSSLLQQRPEELGMGVLGHCNPCCDFVEDYAPGEGSGHLYSALGIDHEDDVLDEHFQSLHHRTKNNAS